MKAGRMMESRTASVMLLKLISSSVRVELRSRARDSSSRRTSSMPHDDNTRPSKGVSVVRCSSRTSDGPVPRYIAANSGEVSLGNRCPREVQRKRLEYLTLALEKALGDDSAWETKSALTSRSSMAFAGSQAPGASSGGVGDMGSSIARDRGAPGG